MNFKQKRIIYFVIALFVLSFSIFSREYIKKYSLTELWSSNGASGESIYELKIKDTQRIRTIKRVEVRAVLTHTITPFSQVISEEIILKLTNDGKYEFVFTDPWNNKAFGWVIFHANNVELYLDCNDFDESGKNYARLYGDTVILEETSE